MKGFFRCIAIVIPASLLLISCATTKLTHVWTDEAYHGAPFSHVLVVGVSDEERVRRSFEDEFVKRLKEIGIEGVASAAAIPSDQKLEKKAIVSAVERFGVDAVLVTHLLGVDKKETYHRESTHYRPSPYHYGGYYGYYGNVYSYAHSPGYYTTHVTVRLETNLYEAETEDLIWSGKSETLDPKSKPEMIDSVINVVVKNLQKDKLLPQK
jgi:hypothetical protein